MRAKEPYTRRTSWAMSEQNVEVVRGYFEVFNKWLASYWSDPKPALEESPNGYHYLDKPARRRTRSG